MFSWEAVQRISDRLSDRTGGMLLDHNEAVTGVHGDGMMDRSRVRVRRVLSHPRPREVWHLSAKLWNSGHLGVGRCARASTGQADVKHRVAGKDSNHDRLDNQPCDQASTAMLHPHTHSLQTFIVLVNEWKKTLRKRKRLRENKERQKEGREAEQKERKYMTAVNLSPHSDARSQSRRIQGMVFGDQQFTYIQSSPDHLGSVPVT